MHVVKFIKPLSMQIFSIIIAFFLWFYVLSSAETKLEKKVQVHYVVPEDFAIVNRVPKTIIYSLNGPKALVRNLAGKEEHIKINISNIYRSGQTTYEFNIDSLGIKFPFGINIENVKPNTIQVELEKKLTKEVPVSLQTVGDIPSDHKLMQWSVVPNKITITGPRSLVRTYDEVKTLPISLSNLIESGTISSNLYHIDDRVELSNKKVDYQFEVQPTRANMVIKNIPIHYLTTKNVGNANRRTVNLMVLAENNIDLNLKKEKIKVIAVVPDDAKGQIDIELKAELPKGLYLLEIMPKKVEVNIK